MCNLVGDCRDLARRRALVVQKARRGAPKRCLGIDDAVCHLAVQHRKAGLREFGADVLCDDGVACGLGEDAAEHRPPSADAIDEHIQRIQHDRAGMVA